MRIIFKSMLAVPLIFASLFAAVTSLMVMVGQADLSHAAREQQALIVLLSALGLLKVSDALQAFVDWSNKEPSHD